MELVREPAAAHGAQALSHRHVTPKALFMQEVCVPRTHSQRHTEENTMQICAQCRYVCSLPAAQSWQESCVELKPTHPPSHVQTFYPETLPRKPSHSTSIRPTLTQTQPAMCTDTPTSTADRYTQDIGGTQLLLALQIHTWRHSHTVTCGLWLAFQAQAREEQNALTLQPCCPADC